MSLCSFIRLVHRGTIKVVPPACDFDCVSLEQYYVHRWIQICPKIRYKRYVSERKRTRNWSESTNVHHAFRFGSIVVWSRILSGYRTDLLICRQDFVTIAQYLDEVLDPIVKRYLVAVDTSFVSKDDRARSYRAALLTTFYWVKELHLSIDQLSRWTKIQLKMFGMPSALLYAGFYHLQPFS